MEFFFRVYIFWASDIKRSLDEKKWPMGPKIISRAKATPPNIPKNVRNYVDSRLYVVLNGSNLSVKCEIIFWFPNISGP